MAGGIVLSNRLQRMQEAMSNFGDSMDGIRKAQKDEEDRQLRNKGVKTTQEAADLQLGQFKARDSARQDAEGLASQITGFGQDVPESTIDTGSAVPGFQPMQSPRPAADTAVADSLKDRLRAQWMNADAKSKGETSAFTAQDVQEKRKADAQALTANKAKDAADLESTKAGTASKLMDAKKSAMEIKKAQAEIDKIAKGGMDPDKAYQIESGINQKFINQTQPFQAVRDAFSKIQIAQDNAAGDMSLIYGYMRILDPGSSVKEGEFATAQNSGGVTDKVRNMYNAAIDGTRLQPGQRTQFKDQAGRIFDSQKKIYENTKSAFQDIANRYGVDPQRATVDLSGGVTNDKPAAGGSGLKSFKSAREAMAAGLPAGTRVMINGEEAEM